MKGELFTVLYVAFPSIYYGWRTWKCVRESRLSRRKLKKIRKDSDRQLIVCTCMYFINLTWTSGVSAKEIVKSPAVFRKCMNHLACNKKKNKTHNCELCVSPISLLSSLQAPQPATLTTLTAPRASQGSQQFFSWHLHHVEKMRLLLEVT